MNSVDLCFTVQEIFNDFPFSDIVSSLPRTLLDFCRLSGIAILSCSLFGVFSLALSLGIFLSLSLKPFICHTVWFNWRDPRAYLSMDNVYNLF